MKESTSSIIGLVICLVALTLLVINTFIPYRAQQDAMATTNATMLETLSNELSKGTDIK